MPEPTKFNHRLNSGTEKLFARSSGELAELIAALQKVNRELSDARRAALNVMEDAILSKEALSKSEEKYRLKLEQEVRERTAELKASQEQYASLVENTPDIITRWNKDLQLIFANSAYAQTTGVSNAGLYGRTYLEIGQPVAIAVPYMDSLRKVFETGEPVEHFNSLSTSQGEVSYYARIVPEKNEEGKYQYHAPHQPQWEEEHFKEHHLFYEFFHGDTGQGLGASHQTGWTALIANLLLEMDED